MKQGLPEDAANLVGSVMKIYQHSEDESSDEEEDENSNDEEEIKLGNNENDLRSQLKKLMNYESNNIIDLDENSKFYQDE